MTKQTNFIDLTDNNGFSYTLGILIGKDLGKNKIIIIDHSRNKKKIYKQSKRAINYFKKKELQLKDFKKVMELINKFLRLRDSEKRTLSSQHLGFAYSKEITRKNSKN